ncbi:NAD(P)H-dependent oxidoreductase [Pontibacter sp. SGAir0037]|uniref:NAD(P)H-dependent oxidoreductase n=1 Tax=Pontibacter sp. SGAir0037 TaxID=2571030 RepID=UPI0010CD1A43|nr:NAD(P)H-dependent oxidoreductase [Pontibacter sp. SGAir0037]QCR21503.1 NAD(P)H-dependent oxidoreductase [Pontibacter sp. SGAir0037]
MDLLESLHWRYATKKFSSKKVSQDKLQTILDAINLSASSVGMQPYRLFVIENQELRKELGKGSFNSQIADASHLLVFAAYSAVRKEHIEKYIQYVAKVRETPAENLADFKNSLESYLLSRTDEENFIWSAKQAYIALGTGLIAAAHLKVDATPMEGFDAEKFDTLLGLKELGLKSVVLLALGYRDEENDFLAKQKKVRLPKEEFITEIV